MLPKDELVSALDTALDEARFALRVTTDEALAEKIGVSAKTVSFWRNGRWTPADHALINVFVSSSKLARATEQVAA